MHPAKPLAAIIAAAALLLAQPNLVSAQSSGSVSPRTPPQTLALAGPSGTVDSSTASFLFSSSESGSSFRCSLDEASASSCSPPKTLRGLTDGRHTFQVWAVGPDGQQDPTGVTWTFTVQTPPPRTLEISGPGGTIDSNYARFQFASSERWSTFLCSLDGASASPCSSPKTVRGLTDGQHAFRVWAVGPDGQQDPAGVSWSFTVVTTPSAVSRPSLSSFSARVGQTVTCDPGSWSGQPTISYRWYSDGTPVNTSQPSGTYTPQRSDAGRKITCRVLAANAAGERELSAGAVRVDQFMLLADLSFPGRLQATRRPRPLPTLSFSSSNDGRLQVKLTACARGCSSRRRRAVASRAFSFAAGLNRLRLPPAWRRKLRVGRRYQLALVASTPYGDQQATIELRVVGAGASAPVSSGRTGRSSAKLPPGANGLLNQSQRAFALRLAEDTGLDGGVAAAWVMSEEPASASRAPNGANNWLNIGCFDAGHWVGGGNPAWRTPTGGADATSAWLHGNSLPGVGSAVRGIVDILHSAGASPAVQIKAIQRSPWASSHYPNLGAAYNELQR